MHQPQAAPFGSLRSWDAPSPASILFPPSTGVALTITHPMRNRRLRDKWQFRFQMQYDLYTYCTCREYNAGKSFQGLSVDAVRCSQSSKMIRAGSCLCLCLCGQILSVMCHARNEVRRRCRCRRQKPKSSRRYRTQDAANAYVPSPCHRDHTCRSAANPQARVSVPRVVSRWVAMGHRRPNVERERTPANWFSSWRHYLSRWQHQPSAVEASGRSPPCESWAARSVFAWDQQSIRPPPSPRRSARRPRLRPHHR